VLAVDGGDPAKTGSALVVVTLEDINDNVPVLSERTYRFSVAENSEEGVFVGAVTAVDTDLAPFNSVYYHLSQGNADSFIIDPHNGQWMAARSKLHYSQCTVRSVSKCHIQLPSCHYWASCSVSGRGMGQTDGQTDGQHVRQWGRA